jgi:ATP-dependent exoDNAse (exonuclease V) beta subunit
MGQTAPGSAGGSSSHHIDPDMTNPQQSRGLSTDSDATTAIDGRELGRVVHDVLERIDFVNPADIAAWCEHLAPLHVIQNTEQVARLATKMLERFAKSSRGRDLATATTIHREIDFLLSWPPGKPNTTGQYIQGVIDCLYEDAAGNWHIIDFKTNDITPGQVPNIAQQYELQLHVYAIAIERSIDQSPTELVLHFLRPSVEHVIPWNNVAREQAIKSVTEAIAANTQPWTINSRG